jgi:putative tryptophan/tyrosine transport system substrate-binding protein
MEQVPIDCLKASLKSAFRNLKSAILLGVLLLALNFPAEAQQQTKIPRIGLLSGASPSTNAPRHEAFREGLRELGYIEGKNIVIEYRYAEGKLDQLRGLAAEVVRLNVDVILTAGPGPTRAARAATVTIPIVMAQDDDPVRRQSGATWREHHRIVYACAGAKRKAAGASEGDCS